MHIHTLTGIAAILISFESHALHIAKVTISSIHNICIIFENDRNVWLTH